jgi:hypothetical protein
MTTIINGSSPSITFSDATTQTTSAVVSGKIPYSIMPTGSVLQVVNGYTTTEVSSANNTLISTGLTASITPQFSTSKILILATLSGVSKTTGNTSVESYLQKNGSSIATMSYIASALDAIGGTIDVGSVHTEVLDSPATTSSITYSVVFRSQQGIATAYVQRYGSRSTITLMEIAG